MAFFGILKYGKISKIVKNVTKNLKTINKPKDMGILNIYRICQVLKQQVK